MKKYQFSFNKQISGFLCLLSLCLFYRCNSFISQNNRPVKNNGYSVAAYVWPSCYNEPRWGKTFFFNDGIGEWEIIKKATPRFDGHYQPKIPLWGYEMHDEPKVWEKKINAATDHGVNTFIFDWYWYDGQPFLEDALNKGFLKAGNNNKMKFYLMWSNHDVPGKMWNQYRFTTDTLIWKGAVDWDNFKIIVNRVIDQYFKQPNYFTIDNEPVFSIFSLPNLVKSFGGLQGTREALEYFEEQVKKAGFPGLHTQLLGFGFNGVPRLVSEKYGEGKSINEIVSELGINSITTYNWTGWGATGVKEDYIEFGEAAMSLMAKWDSVLTIPYVPCVSVGWDNSPRHPGLGKESIVHHNNTPESFAAFFIKSKEYVSQHPEQPKLIIINAWNEWVEGAYLEPDMRWGYGYLEAVKKVMSGEYDEHMNK